MEEGMLCRVDMLPFLPFLLCVHFLYSLDRGVSTYCDTIRCMSVEMLLYFVYRVGEVIYTMSICHTLRTHDYVAYHLVLSLYLSS